VQRVDKRSSTEPGRSPFGWNVVVEQRSSCDGLAEQDHDSSTRFPEGRPMTETHEIGMVYLAASDLELAHAADDVRGLPVVTQFGHRLGEVDDLIIDPVERRARLLLVVSGGILGLGVTERLVPVEAITRVDDRVHVDRGQPTGDGEGRHRGHPQGLAEGYEPELVDQPFTDVYERFGVVPFWNAGYVPPYFLRR
jgi:sporulation protein YlmC with PRC-barrel domain